MAQKLKKNVEAAQTFLAGLQTLSIFQEMRLKQVIALEAQISKLPQLSTLDAGSVLSLLDEDLWGSQAPRLKEAFAAKVSATEPRTSEASGRRKNQDYLELPNYLTADIWDQLRSSKLSASQRLDVVCRHAAALGLRCPSERSIAMLLALSHAMYQEPYEDEKLALVNQYRVRIGKHMSLPATAEHLAQLPANPDELPASIAAIAFASGCRVEAPAQLPDFRLLAEAWPVRTPRGVKEVDFGSKGDKISLEQLGYMMSGVARAQSEQSKRENFEKKRSMSLLALEDWKVDESCPPAPVTNVRAEDREESDAVAATLQTLRDKISSKVEAELAEEEKEGQMKRPAAALRRPAAAKKIFQTDAELAGSAPLGTSSAKQIPQGSVASEKIFQTDAEPVGSAPLETSDVEQEVAALQLAKRKKRAKTEPVSTAMTPTSTRRGSRVAQGKAMKRPASASKQQASASGMDSSHVERETRSAGAASQSAMDSELQRQEPRSAETLEKSGHGQILKRPAAMKTRGPMGTVAERDARRQAVLAIVPEELREQFRDGCSGCRGRAYCTVSCWAKRGFIA